MNQHLALPAYQQAAALEQALGDPTVDGGPFSFAQQLTLDEAEEFPTAAWRWLQAWDIGDFFIPTSVGGKLASFEEALALLRAIARRDLTVAIALGQTYLGAVHVWLAGTPAQQANVAQLIRAQGVMAFALTERNHGGDLLASEVYAETTAAGYQLHGEKWLINNGTRAHALTVFARTKAAGGPRGFSLFLVDKALLAPDMFHHAPKIKTHGIRGADISGIEFQGATLPADSLIGQGGAGLEIALQGLQVTRTLCTGFSLGAGDSALRTVLNFAEQRRLYGESILAIPHVRQLLGTAFIDLLTVECVAIAAARGLHIMPEQFSLWSAIVKFWVPTTVERMIDDLAIVLGARYYLREGTHTAIFQKIMRDNAVVSLFDGSTVVNLNVICTQLASLFAHRAKVNEGLRTGQVQLEAELNGQLTAIFALTKTLPPFPATRLTLFNRGRDALLQGLPLAQQQLQDLQLTAPPASTPLLHLQRLGAEIAARLTQLEGTLQELSTTGTVQGAIHKDPAMLALAKQYCTLHAAAACLHYWCYNRTTLGDYFAEGSWLVLALDRLLAGLQPQRPALPPSYLAGAMAEAQRLQQTEQTFSTVPIALAPSTPAPSTPAPSTRQSSGSRKS